MKNTIPIMTHKVMLQIALKQYFEQFGKRIRESATKYLVKVHMKNTFAKPDKGNDSVWEEGGA